MAPYVLPNNNLLILANLFLPRKGGCHAHACVGMCVDNRTNAAWPNKFGHGTHHSLFPQQTLIYSRAAPQFWMACEHSLTAGADLLG
jgi:hypothetical protein